MPRPATIAATLLLLAAVEITILILVANLIGAGWTVLLILVTSALGALLLRRQGGRAWRVFRDDVNAGRPPGPSVTDGLLLLTGCLFLLVPGFLTDLVGLVLVITPTRRLCAGLVQRTLANRLSPATTTGLFGPRRVHVRYGPTRPNTPPPSPETDTPPAPPKAIEGEIVDPPARPQ